MSCILTRTIGRTSPNSRPPSRASNNSQDCHCRKKERSDESVSHRIFAGCDWKHRSRRPPRWVVAALSRCEPNGGRGNQVLEFHRAGFYGQADGPTPCIDRSVTGSSADLSATLAEHRCENWQGRTKISCRRDSHYRQCRCGRKAAGLRPSTILRLHPESVCRCHVSIRSKRAAPFHGVQPGAGGYGTGIFSCQAESAANGAEYG